MSEKKRIRIVSNGRAGMVGGTQVFIDGVDVTDSVTHVAWSLGVDYVSRATITFTPAELEVEYVAEERRPRCRCMPMPSTSPAVPLSTGTCAGALAAQLERLRNALRREEA